ncbi:MAG: sigma-70 family RNA polymerase sigma factor [Flavobacteriales bacterium]|nr:sigma-70 family RNA polymerase sigma factor [Flavobacteriales bacterium]
MKAVRPLREPSERELVEGCLKEDPRFQEALYDRYSGRMYAVCLRYARHELEAQDMLQEGFIKVFDKLDTFSHSGSLEGWVRRIMVHTAINKYRKKAFTQERFGYEVLPERPVASEALAVLGEQELLALIAELPDGYRAVFNLFAIEGYDHAEIADMLGCAESTSRSQLAKARRHLQERIQSLQCITHEARTSY